MKSFRTCIIIISTILSLLIISQGCKSNSTEPSDSDTTQFVIKPQHDIPWPTLGQTAWPKALHDAQCTGRSSYSGPANGSVKTTILVGAFQTDPVMGQDSVFYIVADSSLLAYSLNGTLIWKSYIGVFAGGAMNYSPPMIIGNGIILVGTNNGISAFNTNGTILWHTQLNGGVLLKSCAIGLDGNIYTISSAGTLYAINQSGNIIWQRNAPVGYFLWGEMTTICFSPDGSRFYVGGSTAERSLYVLNTNGDILRSDSIGGRQLGAISVDVDGNVYSYFDQDLVSISLTGIVRWRIPGAGSNWNVVIDPNGNIAYLSKGKLILVDNDGKERWNVSVGQTDYWTHLICDAQGTIFIETSSDGANYDVQAISNSGKLLWTVSLPAHSKEGGPSLTKEGYLLFPHVGIPPPRGMYVIE